MRLSRLMNKVPQLRAIVLGVVAGIQAVSAIMALLLLLIFVFAIAGSVFFGQNDPGHFGTVPQAMLTLFQHATLASWGDAFWLNFHGCDRYHADIYYAKTQRSGFDRDGADGNATLANATTTGRGRGLRGDDDGGGGRGGGAAALLRDGRERGATGLTAPVSGFRKPHLFDVYHTEAGRFEGYLCDEPRRSP